MDYFSILKLEKEPFSNSPDPAFFFKSRQHQDCLQKIELALRLKRGLNVVMGDVGTGKTTLCRQLIRRFQEDAAVDTHLILDPGFDDPVEFLRTVAGLLTDDESPKEVEAWQLKEKIKSTLYQRGVDEERTVILIFDEGQKLPAFAVELLREFLNYETNTQKLLQIAIFAQCEFDAILQAHANFADRVNLLHRLAPMSFKDTREMIRYRLRQSSTTPKPVPLFTYPAMWAIYRFSRGYPRKIINLCHQSLLAMIIQNRTRAGLMLVRSCVQRAISESGRRLWRPLTTLLLVLLVVVAIGALLPEPYSPISRLVSSIGSRPWVSVHPVDNAEVLHEPPTTIADNESAPSVGEPKQAQFAAGPATTGSTDGPFPSIVRFDGEPIGDEAYMSEPEAVAPPNGSLPAAVPVAVSPAINEAPPKAASMAGEPAAPPTARHHPLLLGRLTVASGDTLAQLVRQVRGNYDPRYMDSLLSLNPHIEDPDSIAIDDAITFPASPVEVSPLITRSHWLQLRERSSLAEAHKDVAAFRDLGINTHLVPYWTALDGLSFVVLVAEAYPSKEAAHSALSRLPVSVTLDSRIRSRWGQQPVFFASPF